MGWGWGPRGKKAILHKRLHSAPATSLAVGPRVRYPTFCGWIPPLRHTGSRITNPTNYSRLVRGSNETANHLHAKYCYSLQRGLIQ